MYGPKNNSNKFNKSECGDFFYNFTNFPQYGGIIGEHARVAPPKMTTKQ